MYKIFLESFFIDGIHYEMNLNNKVSVLQWISTCTEYVGCNRPWLNLRCTFPLWIRVFCVWPIIIINSFECCLLITRTILFITYFFYCLFVCFRKYYLHVNIFVHSQLRLFFLFRKKNCMVSHMKSIKSFLCAQVDKINII